MKNTSTEKKNTKSIAWYFINKSNSKRVTEWEFCFKQYYLPWKMFTVLTKKLPNKSLWKLSDIILFFIFKIFLLIILTNLLGLM